MRARSMLRRVVPASRTLIVASVVSALVLGACSGGDTGVEVAGRDSAPAPPSTDVPPTTIPSTTIPATSTSPADPIADEPSGVGDELYPDLGNPGIDVRSYDVQLAYDPAVGVLDGSVALDLEVTEDGDGFTLDSLGPEIAEVTVDGDAVEFEQDGPELRIVPATALASGDRLAVEVRYRAEPMPLSSPSGFPGGWFRTEGGSYVINEPDAARTWVPSNDHPSDKASWRFELSVPPGVEAIANGRLERHESSPAGETWVWVQDEPMATYLIQLLTGQYEIIQGATPSGIELSSVVLEGQSGGAAGYVATMPEQITFFEGLFGPYPLDAYGIAITDSGAGLAMETQGRSLFSRDDLPALAPGEAPPYWAQLLLSHELAHMWFGDAVTLARWGDIWLNESFATYGEWLWLDHIGMSDLDEEAAASLERRQAPTFPTGDPPIEGLFAYEVYEGGAVILHALRQVVGDEAFFAILREWVSANEGASRTTDDFIALVAQRQPDATDWDSFWAEWLYSPALPAELPG